MPGYRVGLQPTIQFLLLMARFPSRSIGPSGRKTTRSLRYDEAIEIILAIEIGAPSSTGWPEKAPHFQVPDSRGRFVAEVARGLGGREVRGLRSVASAGPSIDRIDAHSRTTSAENLPSPAKRSRPRVTVHAAADHSTLALSVAHGEKLLARRLLAAGDR